MSKPAKPCTTIAKWLRENLGPRCLAPLTGTDSRALDAAVQIIELWAYDRDHHLEVAFGLVVARMQPKCRELAYHAIAHVVEWSDRARIWDAAGLEPFVPAVCAYEPGGSAR